MNEKGWMMQWLSEKGTQREERIGGALHFLPLNESLSQTFRKKRSKEGYMHKTQQGQLSRKLRRKERGKKGVSRKKNGRLAVHSKERKDMYQMRKGEGT